MTKALLAASLVLLSIGANAEQATQAPTGRTSIKYQVTLSEGDSVRSRISMVTVDGRSAPYTSYNERSYLASCTNIDDPAKASCKTDTIKTGLSMDLTPTITERGSISTHFIITETMLDAINRVSYDGGEIELPQLSRIHLEQTVDLKEGQELIFPATGKYILSIKATKI